MTSPSRPLVRQCIKYFLAAGDLFISGDGFPGAASDRLARNAGHSRRGNAQAERRVIPGAALMMPGTAGYGQAGAILPKPTDRLDFSRARDKI